ncbi:uncharacterized protein F4812DRAFT_210516 [Daldinia caldariorum]|uniref:uncharacterized protein n=1 Tax=Daldinia caldariorum TaxID=326644 RepID=UPI002008C3B2|nr:uncharacterized protein F4812DRAFT_210516 [Daldinia caldariorum]KAI1464396.1 hypothetical protein F4812DRAFT_210516 [Daldinia caldariorum]
MLLDQFDDCDWVGRKIAAWGRAGDSFEQRENMTTPPNNPDDGSLETTATLNKETLSDFESLMLGEMSNDGCSEDEMDSASSSEDGGFFPFMELPLEIRLQIYRWVHLMTPVQLTQFAPWYPNPVYRAYHVRAVTTENDATTDPSLCSFGGSEDIAGRQKPAAAERSELLSPYRPNCCMPTSMLTANRQIYYESRDLPFLENEFVFVNWFTSGLWAARSFVKGMQPWQLTMRYARLELLSRDLIGRPLGDWRELCEAWAPGLKGLRLKILSGGGGATSSTGGMSWVVAGPPQKGAPTVRVRDPDGSVAEWIGNGLRLLKRLRFLEVELSVADWDAGTKLEWCRSLEEAMNESKPDAERHVRVCCVERIAQEGRRFVCL